MKYKNIIALLTVFISISLSACTNSNVIDESEKSMDNVADSVKNIEFPENYIMNINDVEFDVDVDIPKDIDFDRLSKSVATLQTPDKDGALNFLVAHKNICEERNDTGIGENGNIFPTSYCSFDDGSALMIDNTLVYTTPFFESIHNAFRIEKTSEYNADQYTKQSFGFANPENAFKNIVDQINGAGYEVKDFDYTYYSLDAETLKREEVQRSKSGEELDNVGREWTSEDNCYYFFVEQKYDGIPVYYGDQDFPEDSVENRPIQVLYSSRGIERLDITKIYSFTPSEEKIQLKEFDTVAECVANKYGNILTGANYNVTRARLYQMPIKDISGDYEVKIVWLFEVHETGIDSETGENFENIIFTFIDAETGEEVSI